MTAADRAEALFRQGYNCAQSVLAAFADRAGLTEEEALRIAGPFGGGIGRTRETCGALSGLLMAYGLIAGSDKAEDKNAVYEKTRALMNAFGEKAGSVFCRELLGLVNGEKGGVPCARTPEYYADRPCVFLVRLAAEIGEAELCK